MSSSPTNSSLSTFRAACWVLVVIAFIEVVAVGLALALRMNSQTAPVVVERVVTEYLPIQPPAANSRVTITEPAAGSTAEPSPLPAPFTTAEELVNSDAEPLDATPSLKTPFIANPEVERLVVQARQARVRDDIGAAVLKLEAAEGIAPEEPNVLYQFAEVFGAVGH
ncbi:MAG: hypothetical protein ABGZ31_10100, partial [Roseibacillus sp.]